MYRWFDVHYVDISLILDGWTTMKTPGKLSDVPPRCLMTEDQLFLLTAVSGICCKTDESLKDKVVIMTNRNKNDKRLQHEDAGVQQCVKAAL